MKYLKTEVLFFAIAILSICLLSSAYAEKMKMTGNNKSERIISESIATPGDSPGHILMQTVTMSNTTSSNPEWNNILMVDYQQADQMGEKGTHVGYGYHKHKSGDQTFFKYYGTQTAGAGDKMSFQGKFEWTGGTGKFKNIKGGGTYTCTGTTNVNSCDWQGEGEY